MYYGKGAMSTVTTPNFSGWGNKCPVPTSLLYYTKILEPKQPLLFLLLFLPSST